MEDYQWRIQDFADWGRHPISLIAPEYSMYYHWVVIGV